MKSASKNYWYCQFLGWSFYVFVNFVFFGLTNKSSALDFLLYFLSIPLGILLTHFYRALVLKIEILSKRILTQLISIFIFSLSKAVIFFFITVLISKLFNIMKGSITFVESISQIINFSVVFFLWNIIYFGFKYFQNYKKSEINALRYLATSKEFELSNLKAQLNPHFVFNCMNSIRALVDEDPQKAKQAITQLSTILRNTLLMNKQKEILLSAEIELVNEYLSLEKIRYEERLNIEFNIEPEVLNFKIPPFIIQAQVENAIKHGVSKLAGKSYIKINANKLGNALKIKVSNTGKLNQEKTVTGVGFQNSQQRLDLLYGVDGKIFINEINDLVVVDINIPLR